MQTEPIVYGAEAVVLEHGVEVDLDEAWRKLIARQHAGHPARAIGELTQNVIDSYPARVPWPERRVEILSGHDSVEVRDHGEGLSQHRLTLMLTLGGSDKRADAAKIGKFGIGFFSVFNPRLGTRRVVVRTKCEDRNVELIFSVKTPGARPEISARLTPDGELGYSTSVTVHFSGNATVLQCLREARQRLRTYRCPATIDGDSVASIWSDEDARRGYFSQGECDGFVSPSSVGMLQLLCKYEHVTYAPLQRWMFGEHLSSLDLTNNVALGLCHLGGCRFVVNCNDLRLTLARDAYYRDRAHARACTFVAELSKQQLLRLLTDDSLSDSRRVQLTIANQLTLQRELKLFMQGRQTPHAELMQLLSEAKIYLVDGHVGRFSLADLQSMKSKKLPFFYATDEANLNWLGGAFEHDFVVLPPPCEQVTTKDFHAKLFEALFGDAVDLATIRDDRIRMTELVRRGIISREALNPKARVLKRLSTGDRERALLDEINDLLRSPSVHEAVRRNLAINARSLRAGFFEVEDDAIRASTGLFGDNGSVLATAPKRPQRVTIGLCLNDLFISQLVRSTEPNRAYYALTYVSHRLALCQQQLAPDTPAFYFVRGTLVAAMRRGLTELLLEAGRQVDELLPGS